MKTAPKKVKSAPAKSASKKTESAPKAVSAKKPVKKSVKKKSIKKKPVAKKKSAPTATITYLRPATSVPADKALAVGVINPWLDLVLVAQMKRYFALLTTLHDSYPDLFTSDIRERERKTFIALQEDMRVKRTFNPHSIAMLEHIGLSFDKPVMTGDSATVRVHGPYRYYLGNDAFEFQVDTVFSLKKKNGVWLISNVRDKQ